MTHLRTVLEDIDDTMKALDKLQASIVRLSDADPVHRDIALAHCVQGLRHTHDADGVSPTRRQQARSAYRMGCAAMGWGEAYTLKKVRA